jgi:hypothetical protein
MVRQTINGSEVYRLLVVLSMFSFTYVCWGVSMSAIYSWHMEIENVLLLFPLYEILCHMVNLYFNSILVFATCYIYYYYLNKTRTNVKFKYDISLSEFFVFVVMGYELSVSYFLGSVPLESLPQPFFFFLL